MFVIRSTTTITNRCWKIPEYKLQASQQTPQCQSFLQRLLASPNPPAHQWCRKAAHHPGCWKRKVGETVTRTSCMLLLFLCWRFEWCNLVRLPEIRMRYVRSDEVIQCIMNNLLTLHPTCYWSACNQTESNREAFDQNNVFVLKKQKQRHVIS